MFSHLERFNISVTV